MKSKAMFNKRDVKLIKLSQQLVDFYFVISIRPIIDVFVVCQRFLNQMLHKIKTTKYNDSNVIVNDGNNYIMAFFFFKYLLDSITKKNPENVC